MPKYPSRSASFIITFLAATSNFAVAFQVLAAWRSLKWEQASEWETSSDKWKFDGLQAVWGLLLAYFSAASVVSAVGFAGVVKSKPSLVKFYRDYSIADFSFCAFITLIIGYSIFQPTLPLGVCEGLSQHPDLMRDMAELGLSSENCERWFKRSSLVFLAVMLVILVARLHFLLAVGIYHSHLSRHHSQRTPVANSTQLTHTRSPSRSRSMQRVLLLPQSVPGITSFPLSSQSSSNIEPSPNDIEEVVMYAPLPLRSLPEDMARNLRQNAIETWITSSKTDEKASRSSHSHRHRHHHSRAHHESVLNGSGQISLPIHPDEGLLPSYSSGSVSSSAKV
ncbi:hypothetical protein F5879DRAFT_986862 [Lentinula edodes]|uniref:uncharacterized protein n=1 Tax=Lentinula edodes TaxID=5353 RepID=UPI001BF5BB1A|nr:uncharacterized protein C8R40DRAFT_1042544 [Lentinula edodes]KAF8827192.1 hypothetical protein HHX47_DHR5000609 [Lentinula edodes]KAH7876427.1 hypothetical protein C8R40DRAFT_1042544 [Lentinula edodes]KAJ3907044.1 hypothetical protein F5879DRAFT_986862 [Lentinula edodes]